jgi:hypothetical protein
MKFKLSKKMKSRLWLIAIAITIIAGILTIGGHFKLFSIAVGGNLQQHASLENINPDSAVYLYSFTSDQIDKHQDCSAVSLLDYNFTMGYYDYGLSPQFLEGLNTNDYFEAGDSHIYGIEAFANPCSSSERGVSVSFNNSKAYCKITNEGIYNNILRAGITCTFSGQIIPNEPAHIWGLNGGEARVTIPKAGLVLCSDGTYKPSCEQNNTCQLNTCSDGSCKADCGEKDYSIYYILGFMLIISGGLAFLYLKFVKKKR